MIPKTPSLFHIEWGVKAAEATPSSPASGEPVGLQLIAQPSLRLRKQPPPAAVLRRSALRSPAASTSKGLESGQSFVGLEFLKCCLCCHKQMDGNMDVFVYKGEQAFCSAECRCQHIAMEERREIAMLVRKRRDAFHSRHAAPANIRGPDRGTRVQTAA